MGNATIAPKLTATGLQASWNYDVNEPCPKVPDRISPQSGFSFDSFQEAGSWCHGSWQAEGGKEDWIGRDSVPGNLASVISLGTPFGGSSIDGLAQSHTDGAIVWECEQYVSTTDLGEDLYEGETYWSEGFIGISSIDPAAGTAILDVQLPDMWGQLSAVICDADQGVWWPEREE